MYQNEYIMYILEVESQIFCVVTPKKGKMYNAIQKAKAFA